MNVPALFAALHQAVQQRVYFTQLVILDQSRSVLKARLYLSSGLFVQVYRNDRFDTPTWCLFTIDRERDVAYMPLNPRGRTHLGDVLFPAKSRTEMRLLVHIPKQYSKRSYQIAVRQLWEEEEVGRVRLAYPVAD